MNVHLAIYDRKNAGIASAAMHLKCDKVILLHRKEHDVEGIKSVLKNRKIKCTSQMVSFDPEQIRTILKHIFADNKSNELTFNASSGYRMMVLVTLEYFTSKNKGAFVVDKFTNQLHWLHPSKNPPQTITTELKISEYVKFTSSQVLKKGETLQEPKERRAVTNWFIDNIEEFGSSLAAMNYIAMRSERSLSFRIDKNQRKQPHLLAIINKFEDVGILAMKNDNIYFKDEESRFYANGGWLENHVFSLLYDMQEQNSAISDLAKGMEIVRSQGKVKNEIDVICMAHNRLHLIECKTRKFTKHADANTPGAAAIYRLDTLKETLGGNSGKAMLVSYQKLSRYTEQRAKDLGLFCCSFKQLKELPYYLSQYIESKG